MAGRRLAIVALAAPHRAVADGAIVDPAVIDPAGGLDDHLAEPLLVEPGAAQHRRHHLVVEQLVEGRLVVAAIAASGHGPLLASATVGSFDEKLVLIVTRPRNFRGNLPTKPPQFPLRWNRAHPLPDRNGRQN